MPQLVEQTPEEIRPRSRLGGTDPASNVVVQLFPHSSSSPSQGSTKRQRLQPASEAPELSDGGVPRSNEDAAVIIAQRCVSRVEDDLLDTLLGEAIYSTFEDKSSDDDDDVLAAAADRSSGLKRRVSAAALSASWRKKPSYEALAAAALGCICHTYHQD